MHTARLTVLMPPERKAEIERRAAARGISTGELVRRAVEEYDEMSPEEEAELAVLVEQVNAAVPRMNAALERMSETLRKTHEEVDLALRKAGIRG